MQVKFLQPASFLNIFFKVVHVLDIILFNILIMKLTDPANLVLPYIKILKKNKHTKFHDNRSSVSEEFNDKHRDTRISYIRF